MRKHIRVKHSSGININRSIDSVDKATHKTAYNMDDPIKDPDNDLNTGLSMSFADDLEAISNTKEYSRLLTLIGVLTTNSNTVNGDKAYEVTSRWNLSSVPEKNLMLNRIARSISRISEETTKNIASREGIIVTTITLTANQDLSRITVRDAMITIEYMGTTSEMQIDEDDGSITYYKNSDKVTIDVFESSLQDRDLTIMAISEASKYDSLDDFFDNDKGLTTQKLLDAPKAPVQLENLSDEELDIIDEIRARYPQVERKYQILVKEYEIRNPNSISSSIRDRRIRNRGPHISPSIKSREVKQENIIDQIYKWKSEKEKVDVQNEITQPNLTIPELPDVRQRIVNKKEERLVRPKRKRKSIDKSIKRLKS